MNGDSNHAIQVSFIGFVFGIHCRSVLAADEFNSSEVQAAYVFNIINFSKWPDEAKTERVLCVAGANRESKALDVLGTKKLKGDIALVVRGVTSQADIGGCDALFVAAAEYGQLFEVAIGKPILVLTNIQPDNGRTASVVFSTDGNQLSFELDPSSLSKANIKVAAVHCVLPQK